MARIDNHIMDDADLAGPFLFCALFGTFLLLVSSTFHLPHPVPQLYHETHTNTVITVRQTLVRLRLRPRRPRRPGPKLHLQHDVPSPLAGRTTSSGSRPHAQQLALLLHPNDRSLIQRARVLPPTIGIRVIVGRGAAVG